MSNLVCIICREKKNDSEMSDEHVIPDSLGGYYHIYNVCTTCNSEMGDHVDAPLVNHKLTQLYRYTEGIKGKSGKIPTPFSEIFIEENSERKAKLKITDNGQLEPYYFPLINAYHISEGANRIDITIDSKDAEKLNDIAKKAIKRHVPLGYSITKQEKKSYEYPPKLLTSEWNIDTLKFKIGLLKIAYEFAVDSIPDFFHSDNAKKISKILKNADYKAVEEYANIGTGLNHEILSPLTPFISFNKLKHYLMLTETPMGLMCLVSLGKLFTIGIILSKKTGYLTENDWIIGINDISSKNFRKIMSFYDLMDECLTGPLLLRFAYYHLNDALSYPKDTSYEGEGTDNIPLYQKDGNRHSFSLEDLLNASTTQTVFENNMQVNTFYFSEDTEYYLKSVKSGKLQRVVALEMSKEINKII